MEEKNITPNTFPKYTPNPLLRGLPPHLKEPGNFEKIQRALLETLSGKHSHSEMVSWGTCISCQNKLKEHGLMMKKLGFKSPAQYREWHKVHELLKSNKRVSLRKYND